MVPTRVDAVGWFPAEFVEEVRLARAEDLADRARLRRQSPKGAGPRRAIDEVLVDLGRRVDVGAAVSRRSRRLGVTVIAGAGRLVAALALVLRVVLAAWLVERYRIGGLVLGLAAVALLVSLRQVVINCLLREWGRWAALAAFVGAGLSAAVTLWVALGAGRPGLAVVFVVSELAGWGARALLARARIQAGPDVVVA